MNAKLWQHACDLETENSTLKLQSLGASNSNIAPPSQTNTHTQTRKYTHTDSQKHAHTDSQIHTHRNINTHTVHLQISKVHLYTKCTDNQLYTNTSTCK